MLELLNKSVKSGPQISEDSTLFTKLRDVLSDDKAKSNDEQLRMDKFHLLVDLLHLVPKRGSTEKGEAEGKKQKRRKAYANEQEEPVTVE